MLVDFMMIGAQKCGTTTIASQLAEHPEICFCQEKEPGFFCDTADWENHLDAYHALYAPQPGQICGEASTMYTFLPEFFDTHDRLYAYNPDLKLIYIMRNPVERVISNYAHRIVRKTVHEPPETAVFADPAYLNRTRYAVQIKPYLELFGAENVLLLIFEEYIADPAGTLQQIAQFLGITTAPFEVVEKKVAHSTTGNHYLNPSLTKISKNDAAKVIMDYVPDGLRKALKKQLGTRIEQKPVFSPLLRETIWRFLESDVCQIEEIMGRRLDIWREAHLAKIHARIE